MISMSTNIYSLYRHNRVQYIKLAIYIGDLSMVGTLALNQVIVVRIHVPELEAKRCRDTFFSRKKYKRSATNGKIYEAKFASKNFSFVIFLTVILPQKKLTLKFCRR